MVLLYSLTKLAFLDDSNSCTKIPSFTLATLPVTPIKTFFTSNGELLQTSLVSSAILNKNSMSRTGSYRLGTPGRFDIFRRLNVDKS